jgi:hypothetical protein
MSSKTIYSCHICAASFDSKSALGGHHVSHRKKKSKFEDKVCCIFTKKIFHVRNLEKFQQGLVGTYSEIHNCKECQRLISVDKEFCGFSCRAKHFNEKRKNSNWKQSDFQKQSASDHRKIKSALNKGEIYIAKYTKISCNVCKLCDFYWVSQSKKNICSDCEKIDLKTIQRKKRSEYLFNFDVKSYPDLFDLNMVESIGWYSPSKKYNRNLNGLTKDHIISVSDAIKNDYDPYYIKHPMNCKLMRQSDNSRKKTKSSMSYSKLKRLVELYDMS